MVQRATKQGKPPVERRAAKAEALPNDLEARLAAMAAERDAALAELAKAKAEIAALQAARAQVVDRLDWVVDSLKTMAEAER